MKVKTLIKELLKLDPELNVTAHGPIVNGDNENNILFVIHNDKEHYVYLDCNSDCDVSSQIDARFNNVHNGIDCQGESVDDIYCDLYEHGISIDDIRFVRGDDEAIAYKKFIEMYDVMHNGLDVPSLGDVGLTKVNYANWGLSSDGRPVCLDVPSKEEYPVTYDVGSGCIEMSDAYRKEDD